MRTETWKRAWLAAVLLGATAARAQSEAPRQSSTARLEELVGRPGGLRSDEVAARTVATSPDLRRHAEEIAEAAAQVDRALYAFFPRLQGSAQYTRLSSVGTVSIAGVQLPELRNHTELDQTLTVPLGDYVLRLPRAFRAANLQHTSAKLDDKAARLQAAADARVAYYEWARARLSRAVAEQAVEQARQHRKSASDLFEVGNASRADVMRIEAQLASNELFLVRAQKLEAVLEDQLRTLMHDDSRGPFEIGEDLRPVRPAAGDETVEQAWSRRIELRTLSASAEAARAQADVELSAGIPQLSAFATLSTANPNSRYFPQRDQFDTTWAAGIQLSWSPNAIADARAAARGVRAKAAQLEAQRDALRDSIRAQVVDAWQSLRAAESALESTARGLDAAEESHRVRRELFLHGRATSVELTDAETELTQARLDAIGARIDHREARVRLDHATGRDVALAD